MDDWSKLITERAAQLQRNEVNFSDFMALYHKASEDPEDLKLFAQGLAQVISQNKSPFIIRECVILAARVNSPVLHPAIEELGKSRRFVRSDMNGDIADAIKNYYSRTRSPGHQRP